MSGLRAIAFRAAGTPLGQFLAETRGLAIHITGHLRRDTWRGGDAVQLAIDDAAPAVIAPDGSPAGEIAFPAPP